MLLEKEEQAKVAKGGLSGGEFIDRLETHSSCWKCTEWILHNVGPF